MNYNFFILGGDLRNFLLGAKLKSEGNNVKIYGFENIEKIKKDLYKYDMTRNPIEENNLEETLNRSEIGENEILIGPTPMNNKDEIYAPYSQDGKIDKKILENLYTKKIKFFGGNIAQRIKEDSNWEAYDFLKDEEFSILNTIPTAEGAITLAMQMTNYVISESNVLVLGYGRVGKTLCMKLKGLNAHVYTMTKKDEDLAWSEVYGCIPVKPEKIKENICKMDIIFNTIPEKIITKEILMLLNRETLIIDVSSAPGGVDYEAANKMKIKAILYNQIPGKFAPDACAEYMKRFIYKILEKNDRKT